MRQWRYSRGRSHPDGVAAGVVDLDCLFGGCLPDEDSWGGLVEVPAGVGFQPVGFAGERAEVVWSGLVWLSCKVRDCVVEIEVA